VALAGVALEAVASEAFTVAEAAATVADGSYDTELALQWQA